MDAREFDVLVGIATAFKAIVSEMRSAVPVVRKLGNEVPIDDQLLIERKLVRPVHLADLFVSQMLAYSRAQPLVPTKLEMLPFLSDLAYVLLQTLDVRIKVVVNVDHSCPPCLADGDSLREALLNLVVNARDAMPEGGRLHLSAREATSADGLPAVAVSVTDNGVGMSADFAVRAVQPLVTTKVDQPLAGMGLAAVDGFARQSGGRLELACGNRRGVTATLLLPCFLAPSKVVASPEHLTGDGAADPEKIRLNDRQWETLLGIASGDGALAPIEAQLSGGRLRSRGLVVQADAGKILVTEKGMRRIGQGR
jgi:light-regulated signal transduction histidine kinase (bacteriophytochrome)